MPAYTFTTNKVLVVGTLNQCGYKFERFYNLTWAEKFIGPHHNHQAPNHTSQVYSSKNSKPAIAQQTQHLKPLTNKSIKQAHKLTKEPSCT